MCWKGKLHDEYKIYVTNESIIDLKSNKYTTLHFIALG